MSKAPPKKSYLTRRSDGFVETSEGLVLIGMLRLSGTVDGTNFFEFKPHYTADVVRVEWSAAQGELCLLPQDIADALLTRGYARQCTEEEAAGVAAALEAAANTDTKQPAGDPPAENAAGKKQAAKPAAPAAPKKGTSR